MKINFCSPASGFGGAEAHLLRLVAASCALDRQVDVTFDDAYSLHQLRSRVEGWGAGYVPAAIAWNETAQSGENARRQHEAFSAVIDETRPHMVVVSIPWPNFGLGILTACAERSVPAMAIFHLAQPGYSLTPEDAQAMRDAHASGQMWVAVSAAVRSQIAAAVGIAESTILVVPNGVDLPDPPAEMERAELRARVRRRLGLPDDAPLVLTVARLSDQKGHTDLLAAMPRILRAVPDARFVWLGDGPMRSALEASARFRNAGKPVLFLLGQVDNVQDYYWSADAFLLPSYFEGHSLALLEAAAHGCPIVATTVSGQDRFLRHERSALLYNPGEIVTLADVVARLLNDRALAGRLSARARATASAYSIGSMIESYEWLIQAHCHRPRALLREFRNTAPPVYVSE